MGFFSNLIKRVVKNTHSSKFSYDENSYKVSLTLTNTKNIKIQLSSPIYIESNNNCTNRAFILKDKSDLYGNVFIEYVDFHNDCNFTGEARGLYQNYLKDKLKLDSLQVHKKFLINESEFIVFIVNDEYILNFLHVYDYDKHAFVLDFTGKVFNELVQVYKPDFKANTQEYNRVDLSLDISIVKDNHLYHCIAENSSEG